MTELKLPNVSLPATDGSEVNLARTPGWLVVFCYPWTGRPGYPDPPNWDDIPGAHGSTPQALGYREHHTEFVSRGIKVFGLSLQDTAYQAEFAARAGLPYALLSDDDRRFSGALGLEIFETGGTDYLRRVTLTAQDGEIIHRRHDILDPEQDAAAVLRWFDRCD